MEQRYILAIVLMVLVMIGWSVLFAPRLPQQTTEPQTEGLREETPPVSTGTATEETSPTLGDEASLYPGRAHESPKAHVQTNLYDITFVVEDAIAQEWMLREYPNRSGGVEPWMNLIPKTAARCLRIDIPELRNDLMRAVWKADKTDPLILTAGQRQATLTFSTQIGDLKISKAFTFFPDSYYVDLNLIFENLSDQPLKQYKLYWGPGINADLLPHELKSGGKGSRGSKNEGAIGYTASANKNKLVKELGESEATDKALWAGLNSKYFAALMIPDPSLNAHYQSEILHDNGPTPDLAILAPKEGASLIISSLPIDPHRSRTDSFRIYVGPKKSAILKEIQAPGAPEFSLGLTRIIDLGFDLFEPIALVMLWLLNFFHRVIGNYGIAIILLTLLTKVVFYPLTHKGHKSMKEMQKLQPLLAELKEKYRDDPQKLNRATMRLYKEQGINPLGGCIPWIPQIPIFWALFAVLGNAIELRGEPFFLWIDDLTAPDLLFSLPFTIPFIGNAVRFLPVFNGLTTFLQQRFMGNMTPTTDNMQAKIMQFLPLIFVFVFYNWASGFVLYWTCNNVFTMGQQYLTQLQSSDSDEEHPVKTLSAKKQSQPKRRTQSKKRKS